MIDSHSDSNFDFFISRMSAFGENSAIFYKGKEYSYQYLLSEMALWELRLDQWGIEAGMVCGIGHQYSLSLCSLMLALMRKKTIIVPLVRSTEMDFQLNLAEVEHLFEFDEEGECCYKKLDINKRNNLLLQFREKKIPGLIFFSSGSSGIPKGVLHDLNKVLSKFLKIQGKGFRTLAFLLLDHFGGFNTIFGILASGGMAAFIPTHSAREVSEIIQMAKIELLPTTPTFINFWIIGEYYKYYDLSSLKIITYGTEPMPDSTLRKAKKIFDGVKFKQTYGSTELGVMGTKSQDDSSLWMKIGGDGFSIKIIDDVLYVKSDYRMVGYLNANQVEDTEGWINTGDIVEQNGEYVKIIGRVTELINIGGLKVQPQEVENVILLLDNVVDVAVYGVPNKLMGQTVAAKIVLNDIEDPLMLSRRLRKFCKNKLQAHKIPLSVIIVHKDDLISTRGKKNRK